MRAGCLYIQTPISNLGKTQGPCQNTEHKLCIIRYMHMVMMYCYLGMFVEGKVNYMVKQILYAWKFSRYVNFVDFMVTY